MTTELHAAAAEIRRNEIRDGLANHALTSLLSTCAEHGWSNAIAVNSAYASAHAATRKDD